MYKPLDSFQNTYISDNADYSRNGSSVDISSVLGNVISVHSPQSSISVDDLNPVDETSIRFIVNINNEYYTSPSLIDDLTEAQEENNPYFTIDFVTIINIDIGALKSEMLKRENEETILDVRGARLVRVENLDIDNPEDIVKQINWALSPSTGRKSSSYVVDFAEWDVDVEGFTMTYDFNDRRPQGDFAGMGSSNKERKGHTDRYRPLPENSPRCNNQNEDGSVDVFVMIGGGNNPVPMQINGVWYNLPSMTPDRIEQLGGYPVKCWQINIPSVLSSIYIDPQTIGRSTSKNNGGYGNWYWKSFTSDATVDYINDPLWNWFSKATRCTSARTGWIAGRLGWNQEIVPDEKFYHIHPGSPGVKWIPRHSGNGKIVVLCSGDGSNTVNYDQAWADQYWHKEDMRWADGWDGNWE